MGVIASLALLMAGLGVSRAWAHAGLVRTEPADNAILSTSPPEIRLWFNEPISPRFSTARLLDVNGQEVRLEGLRVAADDPYLLILDPPDLMEGVYSVHWKVLSETDGHITQGLLVFGVGEQSDLASAATPEVRVSIPVVEVVLRWLNYILLAGMVGAMGVVQLVLTPVPSPLSEVIAQGRRRILKWGQVCAWLSLLVGLGWLAYQFSLLIASLPQGTPPADVAWQLLTGTRWGALWWGRQALLLIWVAFLKRPNLHLTWPAIGGVLVIQALSGHAAGLSPNTLLAVLADALHLLAAFFWIGGLLALGVGLFPYFWHKLAPATGPGSVPAQAIIQAGWGPFGRWAAISVGLLVATGLYSLGRQVASADALLTTLYGQALIGKIALLLIAGGIGLLNSLALHPSLAAPVARWLRRRPGWRPLNLSRLPSLILIEASLGVFIFALVGVITAIAPARGPEFTPPPEVNLQSMTQTVDDLVVNFSVKPNLPGQNVFTLRVASQRRPPPAEVLRVILRFTYLDQDMGSTSADAQPIEPGLYRLGGGYFSLAGRWQVDVIVRRKGIEDSVARFAWVVPSGKQASPPLVSNRPWERWLTPAGVLLLLVVLTLALTLRPRPAAS